MPVSQKTVYTNAERTELADEGADGAVLLAREGAYISEADAKRHKISTEEAPIYDAVVDHAEKHQGESEREAAFRHDAMLSVTGGDDDGPAVDGERDDVKGARSAPATKAVSRAPDNKAG